MESEAEGEIVWPKGFFPAGLHGSSDGEGETERRGTMGGEEAAESGLVEEEVDLDGGFLIETELITAEEEEWEIAGTGDPALTGDGGETEAAVLGWAERGEPEERWAERGRAELDVCLGPLEESRAPVRISLEEAERYSRFCRRCRWLCGKVPPGHRTIRRKVVPRHSFCINLSYRQSQPKYCMHTSGKKNLHKYFNTKFNLIAQD